MAEVKRTLVAQQALETSDLLNMRFANQLVGKTPRRKLVATVPDGPSTEGGRKARQSLVLAPVDDPTAGTMMCGWMDVGAKKAELRSYDAVRQQFEQRYQNAFDVTQVEYETLFEQVHPFLAQYHGFDVAVVQAAAGPARDSMAMPEPPPESGASPLLWVGIAVGVAGLAALGWLMLG